MTNKIQSDQHLIDIVNELQELKEQPKDFAQRVFEVVEDSENLSNNPVKKGVEK